jgi:hypothetical protein
MCVQLLEGEGYETGMQFIRAVELSTRARLKSIGVET